MLTLRMCVFHHQIIRELESIPCYGGAVADVGFPAAGKSECHTLRIKAWHRRRHSAFAIMIITPVGELSLSVDREATQSASRQLGQRWQRRSPPRPARPMPRNREGLFVRGASPMRCGPPRAPRSNTSPSIGTCIGKKGRLDAEPGVARAPANSKWMFATRAAQKRRPPPRKNARTLTQWA